MKSSNYVIYLKKRMDMGKCTSCILYIKQNPTTYKETTISQRNSTLIAAFLLESSTTNQSIPNNIIYSPHTSFSKKKEEQKMVINRVLVYSDVYFSCLFFESFAKITVFLLKLVFFYSYLKLPLNRPLDTKWIGRA